MEDILHYGQNLQQRVTNNKKIYNNNNNLQMCAYRGYTIWFYVENMSYY